MPVLVILLGVVIVLIVFGGRAVAGKSTPVTLQKGPFDALYKQEGELQRLDWRLLKAIAIIESFENPDAVNPSDPSYGLMGVLCTPDGKGGCKNRLPALTDWPPPGGSVSLRDPATNIHYGAEILAWNVQHAGTRKGIAMYNSISAAASPHEGPFPNQGYVDAVLHQARLLGLTL